MTPGLRPVEGSPREVFALVEAWVRDGGEPIVMRTSGSTGEPKDVVLSHGAVLASAQASLDRLGGPGGWLQAMPVTGVGGLQVLVRSAVAGLEPVYADEHASLGAAIAAIPGPRRYASLVPTQVHRLVESGEVGVLAGLDAVLIGGAAVPSDLLDALRSAGVRVVRTYGMSETCGGCVYDGLPLDGVQVRIDDGRPGAPCRARCCSTAMPTPRRPRGCCTTAGSPPPTSGSIDEDGRLHITGRSDDVVISGGVNIPLQAVTAALRTVRGRTRCGRDRRAGRGVGLAGRGLSRARRCGVPRRAAARRAARRCRGGRAAAHVGAARGRPARRPPAAPRRQAGPRGSAARVAC